MRLSGKVEKWVILGLGVVSLAVLANLALRLSRVWRRGGRASAPTAALAKRRREKVAPRGDDLSRYNPVVRLDLLEQLQNRPLPALARNPFEAEALSARPSPTPVPSTSTPAPPPPPPPVSLKPLGYSEKPGGVREVSVSEEDQVYVVHEGDTVAGKYKILKISPEKVTVEDISSHNTTELPIPQ